MAGEEIERQPHRPRLLGVTHPAKRLPTTYDLANQPVTKEPQDNCLSCGSKVSESN